MQSLKKLIAKVAEGKSLSLEESREAFTVMMSGEATPAQTGAFLMALRVRGETVEEITGGAQVMRAKALALEAPSGAIDTCGTGGDSHGTYNISTAAAIVLAGGGVPVAKHGNKAVSSKSGSADVLTALGVNIEADMATVARCLREVGITFMLAPRHHGAMRHVGPARAELGTRTIFNLLGPLANPAGIKRQVIGVYDRKWILPLAEVLQKLGAEHVWVVHGADGLDELTTTGVTYVAELKDGKIRDFEVTPEEAGLKRASLQDLKGGDTATNALALTDLLRGQKSPYRDIVLLNAAAGFVVAGRAATLAEGVELAAKTIDSGAALKTLERWAALSQESRPHE